ncbi:MAG: hypothetical protein HWE14_12690 [Flavobacteriia bacterium]|nr:hypothetical protein [Flavobacteriia bacterium]
MRKAISLFLMLFWASGYAQNADWTWLSGDVEPDSLGEYGTMGVSSPANKPPSRTESFTWTDLDGNLWLFGGIGRGDDKDVFGVGYADMWKYDVSSGEWTWMNGPKVGGAAGVQGVSGVFDPSYHPEARYRGYTWVGQDGTLWLFGGTVHNGSSPTNDLWKFDVTTAEWAWVTGGTTAGFSIFSASNGQGVASTSNLPGARTGGVSWTDLNGDFWLFGGLGRSSTSSGWLNDLWKFSPSTGEWTWVNGSLNLVYQSGEYGSKGVASSSNFPGGRWASAGTVASDGSLYLFGGFGRDAQDSVGALNELWKFDLTTQQWAWVSGDSIFESVGSYGVKGVASPTNEISARTFASIWEDDYGNLRIFGGRLEVQSGNFLLNDLWQYSPLDDEWTWIDGPNTYDGVSVYGSQGVSDPANTPGARYKQSSWKSPDGDLYLFGGLGYATSSSGGLNDFWKYSEEQIVWNGTTWVGGTPDSTSSVLIESSVSPGDFVCNNMEIATAVGLTFTSSMTVSVHGSINNLGLGFDGTGGTLVLKKDGTCNLGGNAIDFGGVIDIRGNTVLNTNDSLTILATSASDYGEIIGEGTVLGKVAAQSWLDLAGGASDGRYFHLGSPFTNATLEDFNETGALMVSSSGTDGTVWEWDAAAAEWIAAGGGSISSIASQGRGYAIFAGSNAYGDFTIADAGAIELSGDLTTTNVTSTLSYNDGQGSSLTFAGGTSVSATQGWNLIANPFLSQLSWDQVTVPAQVSTAIYIWDGANFIDYNNGLGAGSGYVAPFQAFWVQLTSDPGTTVDLTFDRSEAAGVRVANNSSPLYKSRSNIDAIKLTVEDVSANVHDQVFIGFDPSATAAFDDDFDSRKLVNAPHVPTMSVVHNGEHYSICRLPSGQTTSFPLALDYTINQATMTIGIDRLPLTSYTTVVLEDKQTGVNHDLTASDYTFTYDENYTSNRFVVHFEGSTIGIEERYNDDLRAWAEDDAFYAAWSKKGTAEVRVYSITGQQIATATADSEVEIPSSAHGVFIVNVKYEDGRSESVKVIK